MTEEVEYGYGGVTKAKISHKYDINGNVVEDVYYSRGGILDNKTIYKRDDFGNVLEEVTFNSSNAITYRVVYKYDDKQLLNEVSYYQPANTLINKMIYEYGERGNKIGDLTFGKDSIFESRYTYKYRNDNDEMIEEISYDENGNIISWSMSKDYSIDKHGNWLRQIIFLNGKKRLLVKRKIEYYK